MHMFSHVRVHVHTHRHTHTHSNPHLYTKRRVLKHHWVEGDVELPVVKGVRTLHDVQIGQGIWVMTLFLVVPTP